jgi:5-methyltetrahydrofolate--homocysteine methyltransferase
MCLPDKIVEEAIREQVDVIGLSGLITPSLEEMVNVAKALERSPLRVPLVIGGAATSLEHTLLNISTVYSGPTVWGRDASQMVTIVNQLLSQEDQWEVARQLNGQAQKAHVSEQEIELETLTMARKNKMNLF